MLEVLGTGSFGSLRGARQPLLESKWSQIAMARRMLLLRPKDAEGLGEEEVSQLQNLNSSQSQNRKPFHSYPNDFADWMAVVYFRSVVNGDQGKFH